MAIGKKSKNLKVVSSLESHEFLNRDGNLESHNSEDKIDCDFFMRLWFELKIKGKGRISVITTQYCAVSELLMRTSLY